MEIFKKPTSCESILLQVYLKYLQNVEKYRAMMGLQRKPI